MSAEVSVCSKLFKCICVLDSESVVISACAFSKTFVGEIVQLSVRNYVHIFLLV